jgi:hypothetical protein
MIKLANDSSARFNPNMDSLLQKDLSQGITTMQVKYFYFYKSQENNLKKKKDSEGYTPTPYERVIKSMTHEDKIMQKNLKIMLADCDYLEQFGYNIRNKNTINEILRVVEQAIEKYKA